MARHTLSARPASGDDPLPDPGNNSTAALLTELHTSRAGLSAVEAQRRILVYGRNELVRHHRRRWPQEVARQFTQPLAVLLGVAAVLAWLSGTRSLATAVVAVIVMNAVFAFVQEMQAERAVEALSKFLPATARVVRDGVPREVDAGELVPGDVMIVGEGDRVCADGTVLDGSLSMDMSALTGESVTVSRSADTAGRPGTGPQAQNLVFSGTSCTGGDAHALVTRIGMHTELGRIAALSQRVRTDPSPLERQVRRVTWIIAAVAVTVGAAFLPIGVAAGLGWAAAASFSIGLIVANVPEGLLPTITLALAAGVRELARGGAVMKRLSAVETLGSTTVICTDKTGTLTANRMEVTQLWVPSFEVATDAAADDERARRLAATAATCTTARLPSHDDPIGSGDPTERALLNLAQRARVGLTEDERDRRRLTSFHFDPALKRMTTIDDTADGIMIHTKGAVESVLSCCAELVDASGEHRRLDAEQRAMITATTDTYAARGLRVLAVAARGASTDTAPAARRADAESGLIFLGLIAMLDPPRAEVAAAVARAHRAGIKIHVISGDYGLTVAEIARQVGIGETDAVVISGVELDHLTDAQLDPILSGHREVIFARASPEAKLRISDALRARGEIVAMTGDGVNDAPALRNADIGVAMGLAGTDVAREAATMVLTDDNFATIVGAVEAGRRVYDNVRKFVLYIFAHAIPEVVPFLVFALSGGSVPLPLTVLQILAIDIGTETLPALALGREPAEPGLMDRPPRDRHAGVINRRLILRAWGLMGTVSAVLVMGAFFWTLLAAGWHPGASTGPDAALHDAYVQATTVTFAGIVACQIGTAFASRTDHTSLRDIGITSNRLLLWGIGFEVAFAAALMYTTPMQDLFGTAALSTPQLLVLAPFPFVVWGVDEIARWRRRRVRTRSATTK